MTEREALLRAVCESPDDDVPRLVFADWLEENGDPARAEFIRLQCEAARLPAKDRGRKAIDARVKKLLKAHESEWLDELPNPDKTTWEKRIEWVRAAGGWLDGETFDRGFPARLWVKTAGVLEKHARLLFNVTPVRRLMVHDIRNADKLAHLTPLRSLHTFRVRIITRAAVDGLTNCPYLQFVPDVRLPLNTLPPEYTDRLRRCFGGRLRHQP